MSMKKFLVLSMLFLLITHVGCVPSRKGSTLPENIFFNAAKNTAPVFKANVESSSLKSKSLRSLGDWSWGQPIYEIYAMFRDYDPAIHEGIGLENIYKMMYQAGMFYNECQSRGTPISDTAMTSPFDFGRTDNTYNKVLIEESAGRANYFAAQKTNSINYGLLCWYIDNSSTGGGQERGILQGSYDESSGALNIDLVCFCWTSAIKIYSLRVHLEGNAKTHHFDKLLVGKWNYGSDYRAWHVGKGVSRGTGEKFLFKVADSETLSVPKYFEFPADADEATLQGMNPAGLNTVSSVYKDDVDSFVNLNEYFDAICDDPAKIPNAESDFSGTGHGNMMPKEMAAFK